MLNYSALAPQKVSELQVAEMSIVKEAPPAPDPAADPAPKPQAPKRISLKISRTTTVGDFKKMLQLQLQQVAGMQDSEEIEIDL